MLLLGIGIIGIQAQKNVNATGGKASGTNGLVGEGLQKPYQISVITKIEEVQGTIFLISAYPNPTSDNLTLKVKEFEISNLIFQLYKSAREDFTKKKNHRQPNKHCYE